MANVAVSQLYQRGKSAINALELADRLVAREESMVRSLVLKLQRGIRHKIMARPCSKKAVGHRCSVQLKGSSVIDGSLRMETVILLLQLE